MYGPGGFGPGGFGPGGFGPGGPFFKLRMGGPGGPGFRGRRMRRGNVRAAILLLLEEEPRNGYQVMQEIEQRSEGAWRPSPGSVYPAFQLLADEGLVRGEARDGGNVFELTDAGRAYVEENREQLGNPWQQAGEGVPEGVRELMHLAMQVGVATRQVVHHGTDGAARRGGEGPRRTRGAPSTGSSPRTSRRRRKRTPSSDDAPTGAAGKLAAPVGHTGPVSAEGVFGAARRRLPVVLQQRDYGLLWIALLAEGLGIQMVAVAVGWQVFAIRHSALDLGLIGLCRVPAAAPARAAGRPAGRPLSRAG